jgi:holo-[acyl-carrier protein] synthase
MILGIGIDVIQVERIRRWKEVPGLLDRYFHPRELETAKKNGKTGILSLAARFAAKEAFAKAIGTGVDGFSLRDIEVINDPKGKPELRLYERAAEVLEKFGGNRVFVSLTHEEDNAIAMVVIEG